MGEKLEALWVVSRAPNDKFGKHTWMIGEMRPIKVFRSRLGARSFVAAKMVRYAGKSFKPHTYRIARVTWGAP